MNKVMLIGNVGKEPEVRYYEADQAVAQLRLATTERGYTLQNGTQVPERTEWHNLVFYRRLAKLVEQQKRFVSEIIVDNMELLSPKPQNAGEPLSEPEKTIQQPAQEDGQDKDLPF